jgi:hypothetical protein
VAIIVKASSGRDAPAFSEMKVELFENYRTTESLNFRRSVRNFRCRDRCLRMMGLRRDSCSNIVRLSERMGIQIVTQRFGFPPLS